MFRVGDIVAGKHNGYNITNASMKRATVMYTNGVAMDIVIDLHDNKNYIGRMFNVKNDEQCFRLIGTRKKFTQRNEEELEEFLL